MPHCVFGIRYRCAVPGSLGTHGLFILLSWGLSFHSPFLPAIPLAPGSCLRSILDEHLHVLRIVEPAEVLLALSQDNWKAALIIASIHYSCPRESVIFVAHSHIKSLLLASIRLWIGKALSAILRSVYGLNCQTIQPPYSDSPLPTFHQCQQFFTGCNVIPYHFRISFGHYWDEEIFIASSLTGRENAGEKQDGSPRKSNLLSMLPYKLCSNPGPYPAV